MNITEARHIANLVNDHRFKGFMPEIRAAFHRLDRSAMRGNREDYKLAKMLWDYVGDISKEVEA